VKVEKTMTNQHLPHTDSIQELAAFWDSHDLTAFEDQLEEVAEPVFERETVVQIRLQPKDVDAIKAVAKAKGMDYADLIREWVLENVQTA
jgi:predicted DNA binding CopG/RHH family protein